MRFDGGFRWTGGPGAGGCKVDAAYDVDFANPEASTVTGTVCGYDVSTVR